MSRQQPDPRSRLVLTASILLPFFYVLAYIWNTAADVPLRDDLYLIKGAVVEKFCNGTLTFADLWRAAARTRLLGYNLLIVANTAWFGLNARLVTLLIPVVLLAGALLIYRDYRRSLRRSCSPLFIAATYALPMLLLFSVAQWESLVMPFGIIFVWSAPWFLGSFYSLERYLLRGTALSCLGAGLISALAVLVFGQTASFAFGAALALTLVCRLKLHRPRLPPGFALRAAGMGALLILFAFLYFFRITDNDYFPGSRKLDWGAIAHPWQSMVFALASLAAGVTGAGVAKPHLGFRSIVWIGLAVAALYVLALVVYFRVRMHERTLLPLFMLAYALSFTAFMTVGRFPYGPTYGMASRYTSNTVYGLIAIVWIAVFALSKAGSVKGVTKVALSAGLVLLFAGQAWTSAAEWQIRPGRRQSFDRLRAAALNLESASYRDLAGFEERPFLVRAALRVLRRHRLSVYRSLPPAPPPRPAVSTVVLPLAAGGAGGLTTSSDSVDVQIGYASLQREGGGIPFGTAILTFVESENMVTETVLPAATPAARWRLFVEHLQTAPSRRIDSHTAVSIVNPGDAPVRLTFTLRDTGGTPTASGRATIAPRSQIARFVGELAGVAADFRIPADPAQGAGTLEIAGDKPVAVASLRFTYNLENEALITAMPVSNPDDLPDACRYVPYFADGGGFATRLVLLNTTDEPESGVLRLLDTNGNRLPASGIPEAEVRYVIAPHGVFHLQSGGASAADRQGWVQIVSDGRAPVPFAMGLLGFTRGGVLSSLSSVPAAVPTTRAGIYVDRTSWHDTGLAVGNPSASAAQVEIRTLMPDGSSRTARGAGLRLTLPGHGHFAGFAGELMPDTPAGFSGVLDMSSTVPLVPLGIRSLLTARDYSHRTFFPAADLAREASPAALFALVAHGGAYSTDMAFLNPGPPVTARLRFIGVSGAPLAIASPQAAPAAR